MGVYTGYFNQEYIEEGLITRVAKDRKTHSMRITVDGYGVTNRNFDKDPYIKVYSDQDPTKAQYVTRISIKDPTYIYHSDRLPHKDLTSNERHRLNEVLSDPDNWNKVVEEINKVCGTTDLTFEKPDFTEIKPGRKKKFTGGEEDSNK